MTDSCLAIIAYKRSENLRLILEVAVRSDLSKIQIYLDAPKTVADFDEVDACRRIVFEYIRYFPELIELNFRAENLGSAINVVSALDQMFETYKYGLVLEDDCIPSSQFFDFCKDAFDFLDSSDNSIMACGSKYFGANSSDANLSIYPIIWGWCTTADKWSILRMAYSKNTFKFKRNLSVSWNETIYWRNGHWRSVNGFIDAWDIPLVDLMLSKNLRALHAPVNLISNTGNDQFALHTDSQSQFCNLIPGKYFGLGTPRPNPTYDLMLRNELYRIRPWHFFTGFFHNCFKLVFVKRKKQLTNTF
jgi:hypothetical protein